MRKQRKGSYAAKKRKADKLFSEWIRSEGRCERCGATRTLQAAHIYSRRFLVTRWDENNCICLCAGCHRWGHDKPLEFAEFVKEYLGEKKYIELTRKAKTSIEKPDIDKIITKYQELLNA